MKKGSRYLIVCVKEIATVANKTFVIIWPKACQIATGVSNNKSSLSIGARFGKPRLRTTACNRTSQLSNSDLLRNPNFGEE